MEPSRTLEIEELSLNEIPQLYTSYGGLPYQDRIGTIGDFNNGLYKVVKSVRVSGDRIDRGNSVFGNRYYNFEINYKHKLGYRPLVRGTYVIRSAVPWDYIDEFPVGTRGLIPEYRNVAGWNVSIILLNETEVTVKFVTNLDIENGTKKIECKLDFLRLRSAR